jgi:transposase-like protein
MNTYKRHRFPPDIISYPVWLYYRFNLSHRDIEDLLAERGVTVSREAIRLWCIKFGAIYARKSPRSCLFANGDMTVVVVICSCTNTGSSYTRGEYNEH